MALWGNRAMNYIKARGRGLSRYFSQQFSADTLVFMLTSTRWRETYMGKNNEVRLLGNTELRLARCHYYLLCLTQEADVDYC